jgi:hypothetical protein
MEIYNLIVAAFIAMGGNTDGSGSIEANKLITILKDEF